jgi:hypothetical protein
MCHELLGQQVLIDEAKIRHDCRISRARGIDALSSREAGTSIQTQPTVSPQ